MDALERIWVTRPHNLPMIRHSEDARLSPIIASERPDSGPLERKCRGWCRLARCRSSLLRDWRRLARRCGNLLGDWRRLDIWCMHGIANNDTNNQADSQT